MNDQCQGVEAIMLSTKRCEYSDQTRESTFLGMEIRGYMCSSELSMANLNVDASVSETAFNVIFDKAQFQEIKTTVTDNFLNHTELLKVYTKPTWIYYIPTQSGSGSISNDFYGVITLLGTKYGLNTTLMKQDVDLDQKTAQVRGRIFGELLRSSLGGRGASQTETIQGHETIYERRVRVSIEAAALLASLFFCLLPFIVVYHLVLTR
jgi:hypothetical protein